MIEKIIYAESREEGIELMEKIEAASVSIEETSLEDTYLYIVGGVAFYSGSASHMACLRDHDFLQSS